MADYSTRILFCEQLFDDGRSTPALRRAYLKPLRESVLSAQNSGGVVQSTSSNGAAVAFQIFNGWAPAVAAELLREAYTWADCADVATALALIVPVSRVSIGDFAGATW